MSDVLSVLAEKYGTDKVVNGYTKHYDSLFGNIRETATNVLEIGVFGGASLAMWKEYFLKATIWGIDNNEQYLGNNPNFKLYKVDQSKESEMKKFEEHCGTDFDLILDDGSHFQNDQQMCCKVLFPRVKVGGYYVIEDCETEFNAKLMGGWGEEPDGSNITLSLVEQWLSGKDYMLFGDKYLTEHAGKIEIIWGACNYRKYDLCEKPCSGNWPGAVSVVIRKK
jgi:hypothetical protein